MNDLVRFISNSLKPFGYHVRKYKAPNILKIPNIETNDNAENIEALRHAANKNYFPEDSDLNHMVIYVRTCIRTNRNIDTSQRLTKVSLEENTLRCLRSLVSAVNYTDKNSPERKIELIVLDDRSDAEPLAKIKNVLEGLRVHHSIEETRETGQGQSLYQQFSDSRAHNALVYFCEDDYLHEEDAISVCWDFYEHMAESLQSHLVVYPQEHPVLYSDHYPSYLVMGLDRHWRTMRHATHTFITHSYVVRDFWKYFENTKYVGVRKKRKKGSEARTTNKLFKHLPGFSPLKPAAVHLQFEETMPPFYDWAPLWEANSG